MSNYAYLHARPGTVEASDDHKRSVSIGQLKQGFKWMKRDDLCFKVSSSDIPSKLAEGFTFGRIMKSMNRMSGSNK